MRLLERDTVAAAFQRCLESYLTGDGRLVVVTGEAGIGKTAVVSEFLRALDPQVRPVMARCDDLLTPRPLGPMHDLALQLGPPLSDLVAADAGSGQLFAAFAGQLAGPLRPAVVVVEDLHWADSATLDWLGYLARRLADIPLLLVLTYRDDEPGVVAEVGRVLAAAPRDAIERHALAPLSADAARALLAGRPVEPLMRIAGGNPLFLSELAAAPAGGVPASVREAVLSRTVGLDEAEREVLEVVAAVPSLCDWWLLEQLVGPGRTVASGLLVEGLDGLAFRHEVVRQVVEESIPQVRRRALHGRILAALEDADGDPARLAHHARLAGRSERVLIHARAAARVAVAAGAHRQAMQQYRAAVDHAALLPLEEQADLLDVYAEEARICALAEDAVAARRRALGIWSELGRVDRRGRELAALGRLHWWAGDHVQAERRAREAVALLEPLGPGADLSSAYGCLADVLMGAGDPTEAARWDQQAMRTARELDDPVVLARTLSDTGSTVFLLDASRGEALLEQAFALADAGGQPEIAGRAACNLAQGYLYRRHYEAAGQRLQRALVYARQHELPAYEAHVLGLLSRWSLDLGDWEEAERDARDMLALGHQPGVSLCGALVTLGLMHARRGDPEAVDVLDNAWERALHTGDLQRIAPTAAARAELAWLQGDPDGVRQAASEGFHLATRAGEPWAVGELGWWLRVTGLPVELPVAADPYRRLAEGDWRGAALEWEQRGLPYERALALTWSDQVDPMLEALAAVDGLGAVATGRVLRQRLRALGVSRVPRGPRPQTRGSLGGLTTRQLDVLEHLAAGRTNQQIADSLVLSVRTVDHHVSAILGKLDVSSREDAADWYRGRVSR